MSDKNRNIKQEKLLSYKVTESGDLMDFLEKTFQGKSRNSLKSWLTHRQISVDGVTVTKHNYQVQPGQSVGIQKGFVPQKTHYEGVKIVYEDPYIIVINKDSGMLSIATDPKSDEPTAYNILREHVKISSSKNKIFVIHRLDRDTSGLMMFAKSEEIKQKIQHAWLDTVEERIYTVIVEGQVKDDSGTITSWLKENSAFMVYSSDVPDDGDLAITKYEVVSRGEKYTMLNASLETGRKNQIRVHMKDLGHPVIGDRKYGAAPSPIYRLGLHARVLKFIHPVTGKMLEFDTNVPRKFRYFMNNA